MNSMYVYIVCTLSTSLNMFCLNFELVKHKAQSKQSNIGETSHKKQT